MLLLQKSDWITLGIFTIRETTMNVLGDMVGEENIEVPEFI